MKSYFTRSTAVPLISKFIPAKNTHGQLSEDLTMTMGVELLIDGDNL